ncbi:tail spike protein [Gordonia phage Yikes]|uniref:Uncharacterized protein n=1 Tax=Gordonia phage Yikes TaxID=2656545 RepID=A0A649VFZ8_9CAUD|nr:tail spike protein [Gordonia phage Yikes]QGJ90995.1 hypothetical protein PBI_YIKES_4 [Gordonia phage Yikes]
MANVWYIGDAQVREVYGQRFDVYNGWAVNESAFTSGQRADLDADPGFLLGQTGPRINPPWSPDGVVGREAALVQKMLDIYNEIPGRLAQSALDARYAERGVAKGVLADTTPGSIPVLRTPGDGKAANWEYIHNGEGGYLWHLLSGAQSVGGWHIGAGLDNGTTGFAIVRNKAQAIGLKIEQTATVTTSTAYGMSVEQKNANSTAVFMEQKLVSGGAAPLMQLISYETDPAKLLFQYQGANGKGAKVVSPTGVLEANADIEVQTSSFRARSQNSVAAASRNHLTMDAIEGVGPTLTWYNNTGAAGSWWPFRIRGSGSGLNFETAGQSSAVGTFGTATEVMRLRNGQIGFFGATPVARQTGTPAAATDPATAQALANSLRTALVNLGLIS